jgi:cephalosporin hydroxylase
VPEVPARPLGLSGDSPRREAGPRRGDGHAPGRQRPLPGGHARAGRPGEVITIDILENDSRPRHPRIRYVTASSTDQSRIRPLLDARPPGETRLVVLDSDHSKAHVAGELALYAPYVSVGSYLIVEDTNVNGRPVLPDFGPGPAEAVADFLAASRAFVADTAREKSLLTFNPGGYLKRIA